MPVYSIPIGGTHYTEKQLINILRNNVPDPGIDDPNARTGTGHGAIRDADATYAATGNAATKIYTITPSENGAPVVAIGSVTVGGSSMLFGWDYTIDWGDKFGTPDQRATKVIFVTEPANSAAIVIPYKYAKRITTQDGKLVAQGSFIGAGFSRGAQPPPRITVLMESDEPEPVGIGDNWDSTLQMGNYWHNMTFRITVMSLYADEAKELAGKVTNAIMVAAHDNNYLMPIIEVDRVLNIDYDFEQKLYIVVISVSCKARQLFGKP